MGIDASRVSVDDDPTRRPEADLPVEQRPALPQGRSELRLPSQAERIEAHQHTRLAADRADAKLIGENIAQGHGFDKHVMKQQEFPGITTRRQFADLIEHAVVNGEGRTLSNERTAFWSNGTVVIRDPGAADGGTALRPKKGYDYFLGLH